MSDQLPADLVGPLYRLWRIEQPIAVSLKPRDAWVALGVIQFATRNPALTPEQRAIVTAFGREIQRGLAGFDPVFDRYMEMGWDPDHDVPRDAPDDDEEDDGEDNSQ